MSDTDPQDKNEHETRDNIINWIFGAAAGAAGVGIGVGAVAGVASVAGVAAVAVGVGAVGVGAVAVAIVGVGAVATAVVKAKDKPDKMLLGASFGAPAALALIFGLSAMAQSHNNIMVPVNDTIREAQTLPDFHPQNALQDKAMKMATEAIASSHFNKAGDQLRQICKKTPAAAKAAHIDCGSLLKAAPSVSPVAP